MARFTNQLCVYLHNKGKLEQIRDYHRGRDNRHMNMTRIVETLIDREHRKLKLCDPEKQ